MRKFRTREEYEDFVHDMKEQAWEELIRDEQRVHNYFWDLFTDCRAVEELAWIVENCPEAVEDALSGGDSVADIFHTALLMSDEFEKRHKEDMLDENDDLWRDNV
jgi:hypothetical protein